MRAVVLGSAAGGGYPQWNCRCAICALFWQGDARVERRTQASLAISADGEDWVILNCTPDIREQIGKSPFLHPKRAARHSPISALVLTNGDIDHMGGLLSLREQQSFSVWAGEAVLSQIASNAIFSALDGELVSHNVIETGRLFEPVTGVEIEAFEVPGKVPLYREGEAGSEIGRGGNSFGLHVRRGARTLSYVPGCGAIDAQLLAELGETDTLLFDGTLWRDDEMIASGTGHKTARRMGHVPVSGDDGSMRLLADLKAGSRIFVHINNTNPLLVADSDERRQAEAAGWQVSYDGMEIIL